VITLGGTVIHKSGNLTGGTSAKGDRSSRLKAGGGAGDKTASKALISEKEYARLRERQEQLVKSLIEVEAEAAQSFRAKDEEESLVSRITSTESRLKYAEQDLAATNKKLEENEVKLANMTAEAKKSAPRLKEAEKDAAEKVSLLCANSVGSDSTSTTLELTLTLLNAFVFRCCCFLLVGRRRVQFGVRTVEARREVVPRFLEESGRVEHSRVRERTSQARRTVPRGTSSQTQRTQQTQGPTAVREGP
jgi:C4-dicarboxylate-specific signal transduction histidine kinase